MGRRKPFQWDVRALLVSVRAALKRAEERPNVNAEYVRALQRLQDRYRR